MIGDGNAAPNFGYRDVDIYPPYPHEDPRHLVGPAEDGELVRVAKIDGRVIGAYRLVRTDVRRDSRSRPSSSSRGLPRPRHRTLAARTCHRDR